VIETHNHFTTDSVSLRDVRCSGGDTRCGAEEVASSNQVVLTRRGLYHNHRGSERVLVEPRRALFFNEGDCYRVSHPARQGDDSTVFIFSREVMADVLGRHTRDAAERFTFSNGPVPLEVLLASQRLRFRLRNGWATELELQETALTLLGTLVRLNMEVRGFAAARDRVGAQRRRKLVEAVRFTIERDPCERHSLSGLARAAGCSPYHLTRIFRQEVGMPLHRYLLWVRLSAALDRVAEGETNLSALAFELGFSSHSHMTAAFRRMFAVTPKGFRGAAGQRGRWAAGQGNASEAISLSATLDR
jgi:AraC family transcriptional regulator